jgi:hypothetical protein
MASWQNLVKHTHLQHRACPTATVIGSQCMPTHTLFLFVELPKPAKQEVHNNPRHQSK